MAAFFGGNLRAAIVLGGLCLANDVLTEGELVGVVANRPPFLRWRSSA